MRKRFVFPALIILSLVLNLASTFGFLGYGFAAGLIGGLTLGGLAILIGGYALSQKLIARPFERVVFGVGLVAIGGCLLELGLHFFHDQALYSLFAYEALVAIYFYDLASGEKPRVI